MQQIEKGDCENKSHFLKEICMPNWREGSGKTILN